MSKPQPITAVEKNPEDKISTMSLRFGKDSKVTPDGLKGITMDEEVTIEVKGKVTSFTSSKEPWNSGTSLSIAITSCELVSKSGNEETSMDDALEYADETRKKV